MHKFLKRHRFQLEYKEIPNKNGIKLIFNSRLIDFTNSICILDASYKFEKAMNSETASVIYFIVTVF